MNSTIILIGPINTGKSTIGKLLAEKLNLPNHPLDDLRWDYDNALARDEIIQQPGKG